MKKKVCRWFFPTNHENLKSILSYGLLCGLVGHKKYYHDISSKHPGNIPVFQDSSKEFHGAVQDALEERDGMIPCLLEIDMNQILQITDLDAQFELLLPAPLPISCVKQVLFKSPKEKEDFIKGTIGNYGDIPDIKEIIFKTEKKLFDEPDSKSHSGDLFSQQGNPVNNSNEQIEDAAAATPVLVDYQKVLSYGGMMCMLFCFAKNGPKANEEFNALAKGGISTFLNEDKKNYGKLSEAISNFYNGKSNFPPPSLASITIIEKVINILCKEEQIPQQRTAILEKLRGELFLDNPEKQARARELADHLDSFYKRKIDKKTSDIFGEAASEIERLLLYLFLKDTPEKVADEKFSKLGLEEEEIVLTGMLAGARFGFNNIHNDLRQYQGLYYYVSYQMAQYAHNLSKSGQEFKKVGLPKTVFEIVEQKNRARGKKLDFLTWFIKKYNEYDMQSCFETKISGPTIREFLVEIINKVKQSCSDLICGDSSKMKRAEKMNEIVLGGIVEPDWVIKPDTYFEKMQDITITSGEYEEMLKKCK